MQSLKMTGPAAAMERPPTPFRSRWVKLPSRLATLGAVRSIGVTERSFGRRRSRLGSLPDHFSQAGSKLSLGNAASNLELLKLDEQSSDANPTHEAAAHRDRTRRSHLWNEWLEHFTEVDSLEKEIDSLYEELEEYVSFENFKHATSTQERITHLEARDTLALIHHELETAIEEERFDDAVRLRDEGMTGLKGWWVARGPSDPRGHLVYFHQGFGRYVGHVYTPDDIARLHDIVSRQEMQVPYVLSVEEPSDTIGRKGVEVFVKRDDNGVTHHQASVFRHPTPLKEDSSDELLEGLHSDPEVKIQRRQNKDGSGMVVTISIFQKDDEPVDDGTPSTNNDTSEEANADAEVSAIIFPSDQSDVDASGFEESMIEAFKNAQQQEQMAQTGVEHERTPADIKWWDRNRFVLSIDEEEDSRNDDSDEEPRGEAETKATKTGDDYRKQVLKALEKVVKLTRTDDASEAETRMMQAVLRFLRSSLASRIVRSEPSGEEHTTSSVEEGSFVGPVHEIHQRFGSATDDEKLEGEVMFTRLSVGDSSSDPFTGLFLGFFGPHGPELLQLSRHVEKSTGKEFVQARKITGDPNVPAGEISFRASIDVSSRILASEDMMLQFGISSQYNGKGRIAQTGFCNPRWVDGELRVYDPSHFFTAGAELGFMWNVPNRENVHIFLFRVELPELSTDNEN